MQSKRGTLVEVFINVGSGYLIALLTQMVVFPIFDIQTSVSDNITIASIFTIISIIRGYIVRRCFNYFGGINGKRT